MPRLGRGLYPLKGCVQWYVNYWKERATGRADPSRQATSDLRNQYLQARLAKETGDFIPRKDVMNVWSSAYVRLSKFLDGIAPALGRELGWSTDVVRQVRQHIDHGREDFVRDAAEYLKQEKEKVAKHAAKR